ncbi:MAG TPA: hypothetical protein VFR03_11060 [Thermoanaerobaculia bacterium]|nr:hypothetical protein [Thermoanaerobaculia bacterium]
MTRLAIFDLDGTLTDTNAVDGECYLEAMSTELGCVLNPDWATYQHCTDAPSPRGGSPGGILSGPQIPIWNLTVNT